jgi:2-methylaconitate cis-trans-isomerase PrpF
VPGTSAEIRLHFEDPSGGTTGRLLPTSNAQDRIRLEDGRTVGASFVDAGNPAAVVLAEAVSLRGSELPQELESRRDALDSLEELRAKASEILGLCPSWRQAFRQYRSIPKIIFVAPAGNYRTINGTDIDAAAFDLQARVMAMGRPHKAMAITAAIPIAIASRIPGSVAFDLCRHESSTVRLGHPSGVMPVEVIMEQQPGCVPDVKEVVVLRTARKLMDGRVYFRR